MGGWLVSCKGGDASERIWSIESNVPFRDVHSCFAHLLKEKSRPPSHKGMRSTYALLISQPLI